MIRMIAAVLVIVVGVACQSGDEGLSGPSATSPVEAIATASRSTSGSSVAGPMRVMTGRHFRGVAPDRWLLLDPERTLGAEQLAELGLSLEMQDEVEEVRRETTTEVILTGLPGEVDSRIEMVSDCDGMWSRGPGDRTRGMRDALRREGNVVSVLRTQALIDEIPHPVLKARDGADVHFSVHPVSRDGCTFRMSLRSVDPEIVLPEFVQFAETLQLGRDGGELSPPESQAVPAGWTAFAGREFDAALPTDWFYNDSAVALTAGQLALIGDLPADVAEVLLEDQGLGDEIEMIDPGLPADFDPFLTVTSLCDVPVDVTPSEWVELSTGGRAVADAEVELTGLIVTVDGRPHEVFRVEYPGAPQFDVYPLSASGCGFAFAVSTPTESETRWMLMDFLAFMQTVKLDEERC